MAIRDEYGYTSVSVNIGDWDMDASTLVNFTHGLSATEWKTLRISSVTIRNDLDNQYSPLDAFDGTSLNGGILFISSSTIRLTRLTGGTYDNTSFDSTSYNRGWITYKYIAD